MSDRRFEWNVSKAAINARKHRIAFEEAITVWRDPDLVFAEDPKHSDAEDRVKAIGFSDRNRLLSVIFTDRDHAIRIITAWKASAADKAAYAEALD